MLRNFATSVNAQRSSFAFCIGTALAKEEPCSVFVITHGLSPLVGIGFADLAAGRQLERANLILIALAGAAPDILSPHLSLDARLHSWTHNLWFLLGSIPVWLLLAHRFADTRWLTTGLLMVFATGFHLFCDAISGGIAWLYPYSDEVIARRWVPYSWWLALDALFMVLTGLLWWLRQRAWKKRIQTRDTD